MGQRGRPLARNVLNESSSPRNVDHLKPPTNAENRNSTLAGLLEKREIRRVAPLIELDARVRGFKLKFDQSDFK